ncbi:BRO-N domain-containing protein [Selenomonas ruminantium]|uniref:HNH endonuclease n=1 Tax=Selenomonas ruminantium TaxID=971 RepID=A0A1I0Y9F4_SELRU|nr:Bro-N domain-containing protein [Selenomonas ruminantium]SFB09979.1 HNH endonuclease [Selenomonas ruminantium]
MDKILLFGEDIFKDVRSVTEGPMRWYVANDVCRALGIKNSRDAVSRLDADERRMVTMKTNGGEQKMNAISVSGVYRLIFTSHKGFAKEYQRWVTHDVLPILNQEGKHGMAVDGVSKKLDELTELLTQSGIVKPFVNPRYTFDNLMSRFMQAVPRSHARDFYEALGEWYGLKVPYSSAIHVTVKEWLMERIPMEVMSEFVIGVETETIVKSQTGRWVSLNGAFGNQVEWERTKNEFGHKCAYCGKENVPLIPEHIVPQSIMSKENPKKVDLVENIVPACAECNANKKAQPFGKWYTEQPFFSKARLRKIQEHYRKYCLE